MPHVVECLLNVEKQTTNVFSTAHVLLHLLRQVEEIVRGAAAGAESRLAVNEEASALRCCVDAVVDDSLGELAEATGDTDWTVVGWIVPSAFALEQHRNASMFP